MRVLHIAVHLGGGAGKAIAGIADAGDAIVLLEQPQKTYWVSAAEKKGVLVTVCPKLEQLKRLLAEAELVVINWWGHPLMVSFVAELTDVSCRLVIYCHVNGCVYPYLPFSFLDVFDMVLFTTPYSYENPLWTETERSVIEQKSAVVYGMGAFEPASLTSRLSYEANAVFEVGYIGTLNYAKLHPDFVAYCEAVAERIKNVRFVLAGELGEDICADIRRSRIADRFEAVGYVEDAEAFYKRIDVLGYLLNGYNYATTENVLLEAMAYGVPIVVLDQGVERYIIEEGKNGYRVCDADSYADVIVSLHASKQTRSAIGREARAFCIEKYAQDKNRQAWDDALNRCLAQHKHLHEMSCLKGKSAFEWLLFFTQEKPDLSGTELANVFGQESKGSVRQYLRYFPEDEQLWAYINRIGV